MTFSRFPVDRMISLYAVKPLKRLFPDPATGTLSILMYHSLSDDKEMGVHPYYRLCTPPALFESHLRFLRDNGYRVRPLEDAVREMTLGTLKGKNAVITFDDGFADFYDEAYPRLGQLGVTATVFLPVNHIGNRSLHLNGRQHLTWPMAMEMADAGIRFGSHTLSHRQPALLSEKEIENEIAKSKEIIEARLGKSAATFSFPFAFPETHSALLSLVRESLVRNRYGCGVTTAVGNATADQDNFYLRRLPVNSADDPVFFKAKLDGCYNWLHGLQVAYKKTRERVLA